MSLNLLTVHKFSWASPFQRMGWFVPPRPEYSAKQGLVDPHFFLHLISHFYYLPSPINISSMSSLLNPTAIGWLKPSKPFYPVQQLPSNCFPWLSLHRISSKHCHQNNSPQRKMRWLFISVQNVPKDPTVALNTPKPFPFRRTSKGGVIPLLGPTNPARFQPNLYVPTNRSPRYPLSLPTSSSNLLSALFTMDSSQCPRLHTAVDIMLFP